LALIGAGRIARVYAAAAGELPPRHVSIVGVADPDADRASALAVGIGCPTFADGDDLVAGCRPDGVVICTPNAGHAAQCALFLSHGVAVLCEKPLSVDTAGALAAARMAAESGARLMVSSKFRYAHDVVRALALLQNGAIGRPLSATGVFALRHDMTADWRSDIAVSGGGVLVDKGPQLLDLMRLFLGPLASIRAVASVADRGYAVEDSVSLSVRGAGAVGHGRLSWTGEDDADTFFDIQGENGRVALGWSGSRHHDFAGDRWRPFGEGYDQRQAFSAQLANFLSAIRGEQAPLFTLEDALATVAAVEAGYRSIASQRWEPIGASPVGQKL
jgi:predicted dehydrogenase